MTDSSGAAVVPTIPDTRSDGPMTGGPREVLDHWLDLYRTTVVLKVAGLTAEQLCVKPAAPSSLSLIGVIRHLTEVEAYWVREVFLGEDLPDIYSTRDNPDGDFDGGSPDSAFADLAAFQAEVDGARDTLAAHPDLDELARGTRHGQQLNLGWILTHLIEEYARHVGHMDLLREQVDGVTGY